MVAWRSRQIQRNLPNCSALKPEACGPGTLGRSAHRFPVGAVRRTDWITCSHIAAPAATSLSPAFALTAPVPRSDPVPLTTPVPGSGRRGLV
jgi:hypothetical protein